MKGVKVSRRGFLKIAGLALAGLAPGSAGLARAASPVPYKEWKTRWQLGEIGGKLDLVEATATTGICPYCSMGCSIEVYTAGGRIIHTRGSTDSYINEGRLCPKGQAAFQLVENPLRIETPLIRTGPKPPVE